MGLTISSRTPEGVPNECPVCRSRVCIEPSQPAGDAPCPQCGTLLWFVRTGGGLRFHESREIEPIRERVIDIICADLGVNREGVSDAMSFQEDMGMDSLDVVELVMELEQEFSLTIPNDQAENIKTLGEAIDLIARAGL